MFSAKRSKQLCCSIERRSFLVREINLLGRGRNKPSGFIFHGKLRAELRKQTRRPAARDDKPARRLLAVKIREKRMEC